MFKNKVNILIKDENAKAHTNTIQIHFQKIIYT